MGGLTYVIADLHGSYELVRRAVDMARARARGRDYTLIFLGDYIDRGTRSCETVAFLMELERSSNTICLKGNHEEMLERSDDSRSEELIDGWMNYGGRATINSYVRPGDSASGLDAIPLEHRRWLAERPLSWTDQQRVFVHAGLEPSLPLMQQKPRDLLWIRHRFLKAAAEDFVEKRHIVHGHTVQWEGKKPFEPELLPHRTNLDTGAYGTGVLAVGVFENRREGGPIDIMFATP